MNTHICDFLNELDCVEKPVNFRVFHVFYGEALLDQFTAGAPALAPNVRWAFLQKATAALITLPVDL